MALVIGADGMKLQNVKVHVKLKLASLWTFYMVLGVIEVALCLAIIGYAWRWPRRPVED